jgi:hypothetical protein
MSIKSIRSQGCLFHYGTTERKENGLYLQRIHIENISGFGNVDISFLKYISSIILLQNRFKPTYQILVENIITPTEIKIWCEKREKGLCTYQYSWRYARQEYEREINDLIGLYHSWELCSYATVTKFDRKLRDCIYVRDNVRLNVLPNIYEEVVHNSQH